MAQATSTSRGEQALTPDEMTIRIFDIKNRFYAVIFPLPKTPNVMGFWMDAGVGISSRLAEENVKHIDLLHEVTAGTPPPSFQDSPAHILLRERIASLLERSPAGPPRKSKVSQEDIFLYQTGMASIYYVHQYLLSLHKTKTVLFGFAFHSTPHVFGNFGPGMKNFDRGDANDLSLLEDYLESETKEGRRVEVVWTEFPSNPNLISADLKRLRELGDKYGFLLVVDDTIGGFCNIDVMSVGADVVVTSLTKSFSGYADVMAGSAALNPSSNRYTQLKELFGKSYRNDMFSGDAEALEKNSRDYLERSKILNNNALTLVTYLNSLIEDPKSSVKAVYYPTTSLTRVNYEVCMRPATDDFTPGYGCLFTVEFDTVELTAHFYDNLEVHDGPHLGAHLTLALPYVQSVYAKELAEVAKLGLRETQLRISVGLEATEELMEAFKEALKATDKLKAEGEGTSVASA